MDVFFSSALKCVGFSNGQPRIHQGNQIHGFGCPAFEIGTTWIFFFNFEHWEGLFWFISDKEVRRPFLGLKILRGTFVRVEIIYTLYRDE